MTAETSNARGLVYQPIVDMERVAQLLAHRACHSAEHDPANGRIHGYCMVCGVPWPCAYSGEPPASPPPAAARGDVRGLVALAERVQYADTHALVSKDDAGEFVCLPPWLWLEIRDAAVEALAAEGVQAGEVEQRARELLAREPGQQEGESASQYAFRVAVAALSQQPEVRVYQCPRCATSMEVDPTAKPEARGVVDELLVNIRRSCDRARNSLPLIPTNSGILASLDHIENLAQEARAALTEARNG